MAGELSYKYDEKMIKEAEFTLNSRYIVKIGDERFYKLMGETMLSAMNRLVHKDDAKEFEKCVEDDNSDPYCIVRCRVKDGSYRWLIFTRIDTHIVNGERFVDFKVKDIVVVSQLYETQAQNVRKYRTIMNMMSEKFFEYDFKTELFTIYCYKNNKSEILERTSFDEWKRRIEDSGFVDDDNIAKFESLCASIKAGMNTFSISFNCAFMSKGERTDSLLFKGETITFSEEKLMVVGTIKEMTTRMGDELVTRALDDVNVDPATGILNKKVVTDLITRDINLAVTNKDDIQMFLLILDIDNFKSVNDNYGHYFGDEVIKEFATALNQAVGNRGLVGRIGGDEFLALIKGVDEEELRIILKSMRKGLKVGLAEKQPGYMFSTSIGISEFKKDGDSFEKLFKIADAALYIAKEKGKDRYVIYNYEKHGDVMNFSTNREAFGTNYMRPIEKYELATKLILKLNAREIYISDVFVELIDKLNIHGICAFLGEDMKCKIIAGRYSGEVYDAPFVFQNGYEKNFDEHGVNVINNVASISMDYPDVYERFKNNNICSTLQMMDVDKSGRHGLIQFDIFGETRRKWSSEDIAMLRIITLGIVDYINSRQLTDSSVVL